MRSWLPNWDLTSIPEKVFNSEMGRRNNARRKVHAGGVVWGNHVEDYARCRCGACIEKRSKRDAELAKKPKRPRGRPPREAPPPAPVATILVPKRGRGRSTKDKEGLVA